MLAVVQSVRADVIENESFENTSKTPVENKVYLSNLGFRTNFVSRNQYGYTIYRMDKDILWDCDAKAKKFAVVEIPTTQAPGGDEDKIPDSPNAKPTLEPTAEKKGKGNLISGVLDGTKDPVGDGIGDLFGGGNKKNDSYKTSDPKNDGDSGMFFLAGLAFDLKKTATGQKVGDFTCNQYELDTLGTKHQSFWTASPASLA